MNRKRLTILAITLCLVFAGCSDHQGRRRYTPEEDRLGWIAHHIQEGEREIEALPPLCRVVPSDDDPNWEFPCEYSTAKWLEWTGPDREFGTPDDIRIGFQATYRDELRADYQVARGRLEDAGMLESAEEWERLKGLMHQKRCEIISDCETPSSKCWHYRLTRIAGRMVCSACGQPVEPLQ